MGRAGRNTAPATQISQAGELRSSRVESLRALAALAVVMGHVYGYAHGYAPLVYAGFWHRLLLGGGFGVYLFFALSGYLLFWPFARRYLGGGEVIDLRRYAINRALRILPLYYVVVVVLLLFQEHGGSPNQWAHFLTWTESFSDRTIATVDGPAWSLVVELHFYVLLPLLAFALGRIARGSVGRAATALGVLFALSFLIRELTLSVPAHPSPLWRYSLPVTFMYFVSGMLIALLRLAWERQPPRWLRGWAGRADLWLLASVPLWIIVMWRYDLEVLAAAASFLVVGACVLPLRPGRLVGLLELRFLATLGIASYSIYLWHIPLIAAITGQGGHPPSYGYPGLVLRVVPLICLIGLASYFVIESPFLRLRRRWASSTPPTATRPVVRTAEVPLLGE